jgi:hypothetical protein
MVAEPEFRPDLVARALTTAGVRYVVVGGLAAAAHGVVRATADLDLVADPDPSNMNALADALSALGAEHPVDPLLTGSALARPASFKLNTRHGHVQVLNRMESVPRYRDLMMDAIVVDLGDGALAPVCSLRALRAMKLAAGRAKDLVDVAELGELHER